MTGVPHFMVFPYLHMQGTREVGPWSIQRIDPGLLAAGEDERTVWIRKLLSRLRDPAGQPLNTATMVRRRRHYPEPEDLEERAQERESLKAAVTFAVAAANAPFNNAIDWTTPVATTEASSFLSVQMQPEVTGVFVRERGGAMNRKWVLCGSVDEDTILDPSPEGLLECPEIELDEELLAAAYEIDLTSWSDEATKPILQTASGMHWLARAWENSPLHTTADAIVQLKTGIEALSGEHKTADGIPKLEAIYRAIEGTVGEGDYLWDSGAPTYKDPRRGASAQVSALAHLYNKLAWARNDIVHETKLANVAYEHESSRFNGPFIEVAERVLRELIKIRIAQLGYPIASLSKTSREVLAVADREGHRDCFTLIAPLDG